MSEPCGDESEMDPMRKLTDEQLEALLSGKTPAGTEGLEGLATFFKSVPDALAHTPGESLATAHLTRMIEAASVPATAGATSAHRHARRRKTVLSTIFGTLIAKLAVVAVAAAAATGGLAATNNLPGPAQDAVSSAVGHLGVHFPSSHAGGNANTADSSNNEHGKTVSDTAKTTTETGRAKGETVSGVASTTGQEHRQAPTTGSGTSSNPTGNGQPANVPPPDGYNQDTHPNGNPTDNGAPDSVPPANPSGDHKP
jgi:hypothetical protein